MPFAKDTDIPVSLIVAALIYDGALLAWRQRPLDHFTDADNWRRWNARYAGTEAGTPNEKGYRVVRITYEGVKRHVRAHRAIFVLTHGRWPEDQVDHRNRTKHSNHPTNLREATNAENHQNMGLNAANTSGVTGVWYDGRPGRRKRWMAEIKVNYRKISLGCYATKEEAEKARLEGEAKHHPFRRDR